MVSWAYVTSQRTWLLRLFTANCVVAWLQGDIQKTRLQQYERIDCLTTVRCVWLITCRYNTSVSVSHTVPACLIRFSSWYRKLEALRHAPTVYSDIRIIVFLLHQTSPWRHVTYVTSRQVTCMHMASVHIDMQSRHHDVRYVTHSWRFVECHQCDETRPSNALS